MLPLHLMHKNSDETFQDTFKDFHENIDMIEENIFKSIHSSNRSYN